MKIAACLLLALLVLRTAAEEALATDVQADALSVAQRQVLEATLAAYAQPRHDAALDTARIKAIVADMQGASRVRDGLWKRLLRWLVQQFSTQEVKDDWWQRWLRELWTMPKSVADGVSRIAIATMMALMLVLIVNEVRRGNWWRSRRMLGLSGLEGKTGSPTQEAALTWQAVAALQPQDRPGAALRLVLATLSARGLASSHDGHTHRQIAADAVRSCGSGAPLARLAKMAERARYGGWRLNETDGEQALNLGRDIVNATAQSS